MFRRLKEFWRRFALVYADKENGAWGVDCHVLTTSEDYKGMMFEFFDPMLYVPHVSRNRETLE